MNMLAEYRHIAPKVAAALEDMRAASAGALETPGQVAETLRRFIRALAMVGMQTKGNGGIRDACVHLHRYFADIRETPRMLTPGEKSLLVVWPDALTACFDEPEQDHSASLGLVMAECGVLEDAAATESVPLAQEPAAPARASPVGAENLFAPDIEPGAAISALPEDFPASEAASQPAAPVTAEIHEWTEAAVSPEEMEPATAVLHALEEISALVAEGGFSHPDASTQDGVLRYAMALMGLRDNAAAAGLDRLAAACDALSPVLARLMETESKASSDDCAALSGFALCALDLIGPPDAAPAPDASGCGAFSQYELSPGEFKPEAFTPGESSPSEFSAHESSFGVANLAEDEPGEASAAAALSSPIPPAAGTQQVSQELLGLLTAELGGISESLQAVLAAAGVGPAERAQAAEECGETIERLGHAAGSVGLAALSRALDRLSRNLREAGSAAAPDFAVLLPDVLGRIGNYLTHPADASAGAGLVDVLLDAAWANPLAQQDGFDLVEQLADVVLLNEPAAGETRAEHASAEDVALDLPDDLNPALLENLLLELPQQMGAFTEAIGRIAGGSGRPADVETAKRAAHTLKGAANTVGVKGIAHLTHHLEDILIAYSDRNVLPGRSVAPLLLRAGDCLETMNEVLQGTGPAPDDALEILQEVLDCANRIDRDGLPDDAAVETPAAATGMAATAAAVQAQADAQSRDQAAAPEGVSMLRIPAPLIDELLRLVGESITTSAQTQERLRLSALQGRAVKDQNQLLHQLVNELDALIDIRSLASPVHKAQARGEFDALEMEQYSELHTVKNRLVEAVTDAHEVSLQNEAHLAALGEVLEVQSRLQLDSQEAVMRTRMVKVETIVSRLQRGVRQAARLLDKNVALDVKGGETLIDGGVLNDLVDPLMHALRNAVDHGIEDAATRLARGKDAAGRIELSFMREGNAIAVRCRDDGNGLNLEEIRASALQRGLIDGAQTLSDDDVARLILIPGFSTRDEATQISGRGIGMDVVNSRVLDLKGSLALHSEAGRGLNLEIRIPLSMLSTHALLVRMRDRMLALSTRNIEDIHYVTPDQIVQRGLQWHYQVNDIVHDAVRLDALLNLPSDQRAQERTGFPVLLVRQSDGAVRAVEVQEVIDSRNLVMKSLGRYVPAIKGVAGAAILGDGSVVPVIDLPDLLRAEVHAPSLASDSEIDGYGLAARPDMAGSQTALVVDDSLSARRATAQAMKDAGFTVRTAIDGLEAVTILEKFTPDIILADMEMPRMNGMELTSHVRGHSRMRDIPVIMITSRSTEKHRKQAQAAGVSVYLTKPFNDDILLRHVNELIGAGGRS